MGPSNNNNTDSLKMNLTSKDGRVVTIEGSKNQILDLLTDLGFGIKTSSSVSSSFHGETNIRSDPENMYRNLGLTSVKSKMERVKILIKSYDPNHIQHFTSKDIQDLYYEQTDERISLSTVSTYLSRLENQQILEKIGDSKKDLEYRLKQGLESIPLYNPVEKKFISIKKE